VIAGKPERELSRFSTAAQSEQFDTDSAKRTRRGRKLTIIFADPTEAGKRRYHRHHRHSTNNDGGFVGDGGCDGDQLQGDGRTARPSPKKPLFNRASDGGDGVFRSLSGRPNTPGKRKPFVYQPNIAVRNGRAQRARDIAAKRERQK
jgi:hypothetical protein